MKPKTNTNKSIVALSPKKLSRDNGITIYGQRLSAADQRVIERIYHPVILNRKGEDDLLAIKSLDLILSDLSKGLSGLENDTEIKAYLDNAVQGLNDMACHILRTDTDNPDFLLLVDEEKYEDP